MERRFEENIGEIRTELSKRTPNLRAKEKYDGTVLEMKVGELRGSNLMNIFRLLRGRSPIWRNRKTNLNANSPRLKKSEVGGFWNVLTMLRKRSTGEGVCRAGAIKMIY